MAPQRPIPPHRAAILVGVCVLALSSGCGHPASTEECREIFDRSAALELEEQNVTEPVRVRERTEEAWAAKGEELLALCVGRRVTDRAMECVRSAQSAEELDACLY